MPRTLGSKNRPGHKAGGRRHGSGPVSREEQEQRQREKEERDRQREQHHQNETRRLEQLRINHERQHAERLKTMKAEALNVLRKISNDAEYEEEGDIDGATSPEEGDLVLEEDYDTEDEGDDEMTKKRRRKQRSAYIPPENSILGQKLQKFQGT